jgi:quinol monooxygenase YgiN
VANDVVGVVARFAVKLDKLDEFVALAQRTMVEPTQAEPGCLRYELWQDLAEPGRFAMIEEWQSEESLATHLAQESLQQVVAALQPFAAAPIEMQRLRKTRPRETTG